MTNGKTRTVFVIWLAVCMMTAVGLTGIQSSVHAGAWETVLNGTEFNSASAFSNAYNNGTYTLGAHCNDTEIDYSQSYQAYVDSNGDGVLNMLLSPVSGQGNNTCGQPIKFWSAVVFGKSQITVNSTYPNWTISGQMNMSGVAWPAFWLTGVNTWPPEIDLADKTEALYNWYNGSWDTNDVAMNPTPGTWHTYSLALNQVDSTNVQLVYSYDGVQKSNQTEPGFLNNPMWMIFDYVTTYDNGPVSSLLVKNVVVKRYNAGGGTDTSYVTGQTLPASRNDWTGWVGCKFTVGANPITVTSLGRWVASQNAGHTHSMCISKVSDGLHVADAIVSTTGQPAGQYTYASLSSGVTLNANTAYYLLSYETAGNGDYWYGGGTTPVTLSTTGVASVNSGAYYDTAYHTQFSANQSFGPSSFKYH